MRGHGRTFAGALAAGAVAALGAAPGAMGATLTAPACVGHDSDAKLLPISATGFVPGSFVSVSYEAGYLGEPRSAGVFRPDAAGAFSADLVPPTLLTANRREVTLRASDPIRPGLEAAVPLKVVRVRATVSPQRAASASRQARFFAEGFKEGDVLYAHFRRYGSRTARTVRLGRATGDCGEITKRMRLVPGRNVAQGTWLVDIDASRRWSRSTVPQASTHVVIRPERRRRG
jgi:hypothetical protein